jgi:hypothetical protein
MLCGVIPGTVRARSIATRHMQKARHAQKEIERSSRSRVIKIRKLHRRSASMQRGAVLSILEVEMNKLLLTVAVSG